MPAAAALGLLALLSTGCLGSGTNSANQASADRATTSSTTTTTTTTVPPTTAPGESVAVTVGPLTSPPLPAAAPGFVAGKVTAVGDSVMIDYEHDLQADVPAATIDAGVSRQWYEGEQILSQLKASGQLGAVVVVGLSTNGPITDADFDSMMSVLSGASRVVFVNVHVDQPWQDPNNTVLASGVARYPNTVLVDWKSLADANSTWVYSDGTHIPIGGIGAQNLAAAVAAKI